MKKYVSPSVEEIKLTGMEAITGSGGSVGGDGGVNPSGDRT